MPYFFLMAIGCFVVKYTTIMANSLFIGIVMCGKLIIRWKRLKFCGMKISTTLNAFVEWRFGKFSFDIKSISFG